MEVLPDIINTWYNLDHSTIRFHGEWGGVGGRAMAWGEDRREMATTHGKENRRDRSRTQWDIWHQRGKTNHTQWVLEWPIF
jgi:hypothetical protein